MGVDIEARLRQELRSITEEHSSRIASVEPAEPLARSTVDRHAVATRTLLRNLLSAVPIGSPVADEVLAAERELCASKEPTSRT